MKIFPEFPSIVFDDLTAKFSIEITAKDAIEADNQRTQILQDHEDAKKLSEQEYIYNKNFGLVNDITEVEYDKYSSLCVTMTWIANELHKTNKDRQIVKRLEEYIKKIKDGYSNKKLPSENMDKIETKVDLYMLQELQKILEGKK